MRVCICATQVPFVTGGAEALVGSLSAELRDRGFEVDVVTVPFSWVPHRQVLKSALAWRLLELQQDPARLIDVVIATRFPSYLVSHPNKVLWMIHQFRQVYDLLGTPYSDFDASDEGREVVRLVREMDTRTLAECRSRFAIAGNPAERMRHFNGLSANVLYPPPPLEGRYREGSFGDYVFTAGRLDRLKRFDRFVEAMACTRTGVRALIAGDGPERNALEQLVDHHGLRDRVELLGWVDQDRLLELYAGSLAVYYAPYDEDYGFVTVEAFKSGKPVVTTTDSGAVLEFVEDGRTGLVSAPDNIAACAAHLDLLYMDRDRAQVLGNVGRARVASITWDGVIETLTGVPGGRL
jgi:glycosyltransferase involved in cell wall biosynthesis